MNSYRTTLAVFAALLLGMAAQIGWADDHDDDECIEEFDGELTDGGEICATAEFSHNLPGAPDTDAELDGDGNLVISWEEVDGSIDHPGAPVREIEVESYEVVAEVLCKEETGNQTITEATFTLPCTSATPDPHSGRRLPSNGGLV
jgi:hypothetical protein